MRVSEVRFVILLFPPRCLHIMYYIHSINTSQPSRPLAMKKKVRSARVPELSNIDTENEKTLPPVHWVITAVANEPSSETGVTTARQLPGNGGEVVRVTTYRPVAGFETEKPICPRTTRLD